jgi:Rrf2 family protein
VRSTRGARGGYMLARAPEEGSIRNVIEAAETTTFDLHCVSHPIGEERCSSSHNCSIRPVWMLLQRKIDDVLEGVRLSDLLHEEGEVRTRVGLTPAAAVVEGRSLPILTD